MACGVCARCTRRAASLPGEGSTHLRGCGTTAVGTDAKCAMSAIWSLSAEKRTSRTSRFCRFGGHTRRAAARGGVAGAVEKLGEPPRFRAVAVSAFLPRTQSAGGFTASDIYMRQSEPPCSRKSAVPRGIFGSLASSNGAQPMERAEAYAVSGSARLCPLSLVCGPLVPAPRPRLPSRCNKRCRPRERPGPWTRPRSSSRVGFDS